MKEYLEAKRIGADAEAAGSPPWEDVSVKPLKPGTSVRDVVGEAASAAQYSQELRQTYLKRIPKSKLWSVEFELIIRFGLI